MLITDDATMADSKIPLQSAVPSALKQTLQLSMQEKRFQCGTIQCADVLSTKPEIVALCVLAEADDVSVLIQHKLIHAYCWENDIPVIKVDSPHKMMKVLSDGDNNSNDNDFFCTIVLNKTEGLSSAELTLARYYAELIKMEVDPHPVIELPI